MSSIDRTGIKDVHALWLTTLDFLQYNAVSEWALMLQMEDVTFLMPPAVAALEQPRAQATALATAESKRLRAADLFYVSAAAAQTVAGLEGFPCIARIPSILPAPCGLMVWEEPPARIEGGIPIRAVSWGPAYDGGTWWSWWTDTAACIRAGLGGAWMLAAYGGLTFHEETHTPPGLIPQQANDPALPEHAQFQSLVHAWMALACGLLEQTAAEPPSRAVSQHLRRMHLSPRPVHRLMPAHGADRPTLAHILRRQFQLDGEAVEARPYPQPLPAELEPWHVYRAEDGHCLMVQVPSADRHAAAMPCGDVAKHTGDFTFAPVKAVLRAGWHLRNGYLESPLHYDPELGLLTDPKDDEF
ncbi:hypothetical protein ACFYWU_41380 [Streptomyces chrestomyceticus]|uniref:hypothetical protein n=1 Tax=Streptomyces chrestomyceticus TaxID=68185 RepID=UPI0036923E9D